MIENKKAGFFLPEEVVAESVPHLKAVSNGASMPADTQTVVDAPERKYGPVSLDYYLAAERGLRTPANDNGSHFMKKYGPILKFAVPIILGLGFLAWF